MKIHFDDNLFITGRATAFTNPAIEAGVVHCRALLEFMGLTVKRGDETRLAARGPRRYPDDLFIEDFANADGNPLPPVSPAQAIARYPGDKGEAERALARVILAANKVLAHPTAGWIPNPDDLYLIATASRGVRALLISHFYTPRGLEPPPSPITSQPRPHET